MFAGNLLFKAPLPIAKLSHMAKSDQALHFPLRQSIQWMELGNSNSFSVAISSDSKTKPNKPIVYQMQESQAGIECDKTTGMVSLDSEAVWAHYRPDVAKSKSSFSESRIQEYRELFFQLFGIQPTGVPIAISIPVAASIADQTIAKTTYYVLLVIPESEVKAAISKNKTAAGRKTVEVKKKANQDQDRDLLNEMRQRISRAESDRDKLLSDMNEAIQSAEVGLESREKNLDALSKRLDELQASSDQLQQRMAPLETLEQNVKTLTSDIEEKRAEFEESQASSTASGFSAFVSRLIILLCTGFIFLAGLIGYFVIVARKMVL